MTASISDARAAIGQRAADMGEIIYEDDTLILAASADYAAAYMHAIEMAGANYALKYDWKKLEVFLERCAHVLQPDGKPVTHKGGIVYLGGVPALHTEAYRLS